MVVPSASPAVLCRVGTSMPGDTVALWHRHMAQGHPPWHRPVLSSGMIVLAVAVWRPVPATPSLSLRARNKAEPCSPDSSCLPCSQSPRPPTALQPVSPQPPVSGCSWGHCPVLPGQQHPANSAGSPPPPAANSEGAKSTLSRWCWPHQFLLLIRLPPQPAPGAGPCHRVNPSTPKFSLS